jgi:hypothetical protein
LIKGGLAKRREGLLNVGLVRSQVKDGRESTKEKKEATAVGLENLLGVIMRLEETEGLMTMDPKEIRLKEITRGMSFLDKSSRKTFKA